MKKVTNLFAWITLAIILTVGTTVSNAGIIVTSIAQCTDTTGGLGQSITGIIVTSVPQFAGILISDAACQSLTGILISD